MSYATESTPGDRVMEPNPAPRGSHPDVLWLIRLRWVAIAGVILASTAAVNLDVVESGRPLFSIAAVMAAFNAVLWWRLRRTTGREGDGAAGNFVVPQLLADLLFLTLLLHYAGGAENPFVMFYAFHMAIGAVFLPRRTVWLLGLAAALLHTGMVVGEFFEWFEHYRLNFTDPPDLPAHLHRTPHDMHKMPDFVLSYLFAFNLMLSGVIYLVHTVAEYQRAAEAQRQRHEDIARSRERLARIGQISAGLAHTIRNPLHGIINALEIVRGKLARPDSTTAQMFDLMTDGLTRIERVTSRLLTLTRDSALSRVDTDIGSLVQEAVKFVETRAQKEKIRLVVENGRLGSASIDADHVFEALVNLLDNALAACREGDTVTIRTELRRVPRNGVCIWVEDTGEGIPAQNLAKVLDPFFTTKPVGEGSGLGLAITHRIVAEHDGELALESKVGQGTRVQIFLPT